MALNKTYGKDDPEKFIKSALTGGSGPSEGIHEKKIDRPGQSILTAVAMDNVDLAMPIKTSILDDDDFGGSPENLDHSLKGASAVQKDVGAAHGKRQPRASYDVE